MSSATSREPTRRVTNSRNRRWFSTSTATTSGDISLSPRAKSERGPRDEDTPRGPPGASAPAAARDAAADGLAGAETFVWVRHRGLLSPMQTRRVAPSYTRPVDVLIVHDPREPARKCSLTPLRGMAGLRFVPARPGERIDVGRRIWLQPEGDELGPADRGLGFLLIDCTWRRLPKLARCIDGRPVRRRLPRLVTAYPRRSKIVPDPEDGLASVEALYAALALLGAPRPALLARSRWRAGFA